MTEESKVIEANCPECHGPLSRVGHNGNHEYVCLVGHRFSGRGLLESHAEVQERALWAAVVALEEFHKIVEDIAPHLAPAAATRLRNQAQHRKALAEEIRDIIQRLDTLQL